MSRWVAPPADSKAYEKQVSLLMTVLLRANDYIIRNPSKLGLFLGQPDRKKKAVESEVTSAS